MPVSGLFSRWSASRRRALVLSSAGYLVGMGEVPLFFWLFPMYGVGTKTSTYQGMPLMNKPLHITFGINNELSTSAPYKVSQQWAQHFFMHGYGGIWYRPRFSVGENPGYLPYLILLGNMMATPIQIHAESTPLCERWGL